MQRKAKDRFHARFVENGLEIRVADPFEIWIRGRFWVVKKERFEVLLGVVCWFSDFFIDEVKINQHDQ